jgi:Caudovirus prohead serine protease
VDRKTFDRFEIKAADQGLVTARFSTFGVVDLDGDVTLPDAFDDGAPIQVSAYNHASWGGSLPVGKGVIRVGPDGADADVQFFMDVPDAKATFLTIKALGDLCEYSYGFDIVDAEFGTFQGQNVRILKKLKVYEISPVLRGAAGPGRTGTLEVKRVNAATDDGMSPAMRGELRQIQLDTHRRRFTDKYGA